MKKLIITAFVFTLALPAAAQTLSTADLVKNAKFLQKENATIVADQTNIASSARVSTEQIPLLQTNAYFGAIHDYMVLTAYNVQAVDYMDGERFKKEVVKGRDVAEVNYKSKNSSDFYNYDSDIVNNLLAVVSIKDGSWSRFMALALVKGEYRLYRISHETSFVGETKGFFRADNVNEAWADLNRFIPFTKDIVLAKLSALSSGDVKIYAYPEQFAYTPPATSDKYPYAQNQDVRKAFDQSAKDGIDELWGAREDFEELYKKDKNFRVLSVKKQDEDRGYDRSREYRTNYVFEILLNGEKKGKIYYGLWHLLIP